MQIHRRAALCGVVTLVAASTVLAAQAQSAGSATTAAAAAPDRHAYFGDLHLHTSYSFDAYILFGAKVTPEDAYRYAKGETVT